MPELPEVETIARGLAKRVTGDVIESVWLGKHKQPLKSPAGEIASVLEHSQIEGVRRMGKHIVFDLARTADAGSSGKQHRRGRNGSKAKADDIPAETRSSFPESGTDDEQVTASRAQWIVHLGMTGRLQVCQPLDELAKHTHAVLKLESGRELRFVDPRRFGRLSVAAAGDFQTVGVEPLEIDLEHFIPLFRGRKTPIKNALLNQKLLRGVGNIYADESLFRSGIRPRRRASSISREELSRLFRSVKQVLQEAIKLGGSSISDYVDADGEEGFFQLRHRVYGREGHPCPVCKTAIKRVVIAGRSSHFCPKCQK